MAGQSPSLVDRLTAHGFRRVAYDQGKVTHGYLKDVSASELAEKIGLDSTVEEFCEKGVVEYLPEVETIQWCLDDGSFEAFNTASEDAQKLIEAFM